MRTGVAGMVSDSELQHLRRFIAAQRERATSPVHRLWAGRCAALLAERERLQQRLEVLTRVVDAVLESRVSGASTSDTWVV